MKHNLRLDAMWGAGETQAGNFLQQQGRTRPRFYTLVPVRRNDQKKDFGKGNQI